ncbi:transglycosylase family protein [Streptomyces sp. NA02950]|uniref:LysM peptidoglycan-binding domain-containing protein n=1 Tax=Streptomyces sp. NA02950 TaxID=2742137 RepID=UPI0015904207|nr:transglycosylase family protein [Streptomyces sp. NA02950]QKV94544.1 transglycosylase family protein [Streptomyces sp. NA02950]
MRSGNGRHRRPRQAPAIVVAAGITGAGLAIPLFGASGAQAASTAHWDKVAECESGGMWSANEGNGFYGGLQLTLGMWKEYGGTAYAPRPDLASRSQQISVAQSILDDRGPDAWPSCAVNAGLTDGGDAPEVDPGFTLAPPTGQRGDDGEDREHDGSSAEERDGASDSSGSSDASNERRTPGDDEESGTPSPSASPGGEGEDSPSPSPSTTKSDDAPASPDAPDESADAPTGRHRGAEHPAEAKGDEEPRRPSGRHASRDGADRAEKPSEDGYTVQPGDSLSGIADSQDLTSGWHGLYESNESLIGDNPDLILPGQRLDLGAKGR